MYPTKKEILENPPKIQPETKDIVIQWKKEFIKKWKLFSNAEKIEELNKLINYIETTENAKIPKVIIKQGSYYRYSRKTKTIYHNKNRPSIISTLHELAHHFWGDSELNACKWSIHLFKEAFPSMFKELTWEKHLLVK
jgi:hypothetical protein